MGATSNRVTIGLVEEIVPGTTPNNPVFQKFRYTGESINYGITTTQSKEIRDDRNVANTVQTKGGVTGDLQFELSTESFDQYLQAVMCSTWSTTSLLVENCENAWNETTNVNVTSTADTADFRVGTASAKLVVAVGAAAGELLASEAITSTNLTTATALRLWMKSSIDTAAGDLRILLDDTALCASPIENLSVPALKANTWTVVTLPFATPASLTAVISIGVRQQIDLGAFTLNIDEIRSLPEGGTIKNGLLNRSFSVQKIFNDMTPPVYNTLTGNKFADMSLDFKPGAILTGKFGLSGFKGVMSTTQLAGASFIDAATDVPMNGVNNVTSFKENGVTSVESYKSIKVDINNSVRALDAIGSLGPTAIALGTFVVTGSFEIYFSTLVMYNRFTANASMALEFKAQDDTGSYYTFKLPAVKVETATVTSQNQDQDIVASCTFRAIYDPVTNCTMQIDRSYT